MSHLDEGTIHALLDGEIPSAELAPIQAHLDACEKCRARLAEERDLVDVSDRLVGVIQLTGGKADGRKEKPSGRPYLRPFAWAATVVLAAGLGYAMGGSMSALPTDRSVLRESAAPMEIDSPQAGSRVANQAMLDSPATASAEPAPPTASPRRPTPGRRAVEAKDLAGNLGASSAREKARSSADSAVAGAAAEQRKVRQEVAADAPARAAAPATAPAQPPAPAPSIQSAAPTRTARALGAAQQFRLEEVIVTGAAPTTIEFPEAVRMLGGTLRLVEGLVPTRLERLGATVRVVYRTGYGELVLSQEVADGNVRHTLIPPSGFPADSLERLRARVKE